MTETRYQRIAREQQERQAARTIRYAKEQRQAAAQIRKHHRWARDGYRERSYLNIITSDHDHSMDG